MITSKTCSTCHEMKPVSAFHRRTTNVDGYRGVCVACDIARKMRLLREKPPMPEPVEKACSKCHETRPIAMFRRRMLDTRDGFLGTCRVCDAARRTRKDGSPGRMRPPRDPAAPRGRRPRTDADRARDRANFAAWRAANPELYRKRNREYQRAWVAANPERAAALNARKVAKSKEKQPDPK